MTDPISDMLNRIMNAYAIHMREVFIPLSKVKLGIIEILKKEGYIDDFITEGKVPFEEIKIFLKYSGNKSPALRELKRISKPGRRVYRGFQELKPIKSGTGIAIISTPEGIMTDFGARKKKLGGEVICSVF